MRAHGECAQPFQRAAKPLVKACPSNRVAVCSQVGCGAGVLQGPEAMPVRWAWLSGALWPFR